MQVAVASTRTEHTWGGVVVVAQTSLGTGEMAMEASDSLPQPVMHTWDTGSQTDATLV